MNDRNDLLSLAAAPGTKALWLSRHGLVRGALAASLLIWPGVSQAQQQADVGATPAPVDNLWRQMAAMDVRFIHDKAASEHIYAYVPGDAAWKKFLEDATAQAMVDITRVTSFAGYQQALRRYQDRFHDAHFTIMFELQQFLVNWPQFVVGYVDDKYVVIESKIDEIPKGSVITACDGLSMNALVDKTAPEHRRSSAVEARVPGLVSTRIAMARAIFVDISSPFYSRPTSCVIEGRDTKLNWTSITQVALSAINDRLDFKTETETSISAFAANSAWVKMGTFNPRTALQIKQFQAVIKDAAQLRDKDVVVLDVRGNSGGTYNWFMAFLRAFYGPEYVRYYARARVEIQPILLDPAEGPPAKPSVGPMPGAAKKDPTPPDPELDFSIAKQTKQVINGRTLTFMQPAGAWPRRSAKTPVNPAKAEVYVLTDYKCASACISFVDEMRRFPGVKQIGQETGFDSRTGSAVAFTLPSTNGRVAIPSMTRLGRARGDNVTWKPDIRFDGVIGDDAALKTWIMGLAAK